MINLILLFLSHIMKLKDLFNGIYRKLENLKKYQPHIIMFKVGKGAKNPKTKKTKKHALSASGNAGFYLPSYHSIFTTAKVELCHLNLSSRRNLLQHLGGSVD